jgi:polyisoprenoid-binding protein YceI
VKKFLTFIIAAGLLLAAQPGLAATYTLDPDHSSIGFKATHLMVSQTEGSFGDYSMDIAFDPQNLAESRINVTIQAASINTRNNQRDEHLRKPDFLDVPNHPTITFTSKSITGSGENYTIVGNLTIRGVTKEISIPAGIRGPVKSPFGFEAIGISGSTVINRQDFGVSWNKQLDQGGVVVGDDVRIEFEIEGHSGG